MYVPDNLSVADHWQQPPDAAQTETAVSTFRLLGDHTRLRLLWLLAAQEYDVGTLSGLLDVPRVSTSQHLARLKAGGLVASRRDGRRVVYRARDSHIRTVIAEALSHAEHTVRGLPPDHG